MPRTKLLGLAGAALVLLVHGYGLGDFPGLHYDEAWAMNFAHRIGPGFWPLTAMSPYTSPWTHYWAALWMHVFGVSLAVFRASQVFLSLSGLALLAGALPRHVRPLFPWAVLAVPGIWLNSRFAIELNGFHIFCFGLLAWALRREYYGTALGAALLGTSAHILFYGISLSLLAMVLVERVTLSARARAAGSLYFIAAAFFFGRVLGAIPEKGKAGALVLSALLGAALLAGRAERWAIWARARGAVAWGAAVFAVNAAFFGFGLWTVSLYTGSETVWRWPAAVVPLLVFFAWGASAMLPAMAHALPRHRTWFLCALLFVGLMMLKPAPRYFAIPLVGLAALLAQAPGRKGALPLGVVISLGVFTGVFSAPFEARETSLRFLFFRDSSRDFLSKQSLVRFLGGSGCRPGDIGTNDPRLKEELAALALGDWPVSAARCPYDLVSLASESPGAANASRAFSIRAREEGKKSP